jgi:hypothetical protein
MDFSTLADSAIATLQSAASGAGPGAISVVGVVVGVFLVIKFLKRSAS